MNIDCVFSRSPSTKLNIATLLAGCLAFAAPVSAQQVASIEIIADSPGLGLHQITAQGSSVSTVVGAGGVASAFSNSWAFAPVCVAPCRATLPVGPQRLALSHDMDAPVPFSHLVNIAPGGHYRLEFEDRGLIRAFGWPAFSLAVGLMIVGPSFWIVGGGPNSPDLAIRDVGVALSVTSVALLVAGLWMIYTNDHREMVQIDPNGAIRF